MEVADVSHEIIDHCGHTHELLNVVDAAVKQKGSAKVVAAADMDFTTHKGDWGVLFHDARLLSDRNWALDADQFDRIVVPAKYGRLLSKWASDVTLNHIVRKKSGLILDIGCDLSKLYPLNQNDSRDVNEKLIIRDHFAILMKLLDQGVIHFEPEFEKEFRRQFLLRSRFLMGSQPRDIVDFTKEAVEIGCTPDHPDQRVKLNFNQDLVRTLKLDVTIEKILESLADGETFDQNQEIDRSIGVVQQVRACLNRVVELDGASVVATMNLAGIGSTVLEHDFQYAFLKQQDAANGSPKNILVGTRLSETPEGLFLPKPDGEVVHGEVKMRRAVEMAEKMNRKLFIAMGDSPRTDFEMMLKALENGGIVLVVGPDYETTKNKFSPKFSPQLALHPEYAERIFYVSTGRAGFVH